MPVIPAEARLPPPVSHGSITTPSLTHSTTPLITHTAVCYTKERVKKEQQHINIRDTEEQDAESKP